MIVLKWSLVIKTKIKKKRKMLILRSWCPKLDLVDVLQHHLGPVCCCCRPCANVHTHIALICSTLKQSNGNTLQQRQ